MTEVCNNVEVKPHLQPLSGESLSLKSANSGAQPDNSGNGFWM